MASNDQTQAQSASVAAESPLAQDLWHRHVESPGVISARHRNPAGATRRASESQVVVASNPAIAAHGSYRMSMAHTPRCRSCAPRPFQPKSAIQRSVLRLPDVGSTGAEAGGDLSRSMVSSPTLVQATTADRQAAALPANSAGEPPPTASMANLGADIMRRHLSEPTERTIQRQVVAYKQRTTQAHQVLVHRPSGLLSRRSVDATPIPVVAPVRLAEAQGSSTPTASMPSASPTVTTIQRQLPPTLLLRHQRRSPHRMT